MLISLILFASHACRVACDPLPSVGIRDFDAVIGKTLPEYDAKKGLVEGPGLSLKQAITILGDPQIRGGYLEVEGPAAGRFVKDPAWCLWLGRDGYFAVQFNNSVFVSFAEREVDPRVMAPIIVVARLLSSHP